MDKQQKDSWIKRHKLLTGALIVVACFLFVGAISNSQQKPRGVAKYEATAQSYSVTDPATLRVDVKVHNTGTASGKPNCHIRPLLKPNL